MLRLFACAGVIVALLLLPVLTEARTPTPTRGRQSRSCADSRARTRVSAQDRFHPPDEHTHIAGMRVLSRRRYIDPFARLQPASRRAYRAGIAWRPLRQRPCGDWISAPSRPRLGLFLQRNTEIEWFINLCSVGRGLTSRYDEHAACFEVAS